MGDFVTETVRASFKSAGSTLVLSGPEVSESYVARVRTFAKPFSFGSGLRVNYGPDCSTDRRGLSLDGLWDPSSCVRTDTGVWG